MKIAVLADIHANYRALEIVIDHVERWKPDLVFVAGDIVNRGPRSLCCLNWILEKQTGDGWFVIRGNHEDYVIERDHPEDPKDGPVYDMAQPVHFTYNQLNKDIAHIRALPTQISLDLGKPGELRVLHGTMRGNRDGIYPENTKSELAHKISPPPAVFITGHTHRAMIRTIGDTLIVNAGSVGLPFDGDTRAGYAQVTYHRGSWQAEIIRLNYDQFSAENDFYEYDFVMAGGPLVKLILLELRTGLGQLYRWVTIYDQLIKAGKITVEESVKEFMIDPITEPYWKP